MPTYGGPMKIFINNIFKSDLSFNLVLANVNHNDIADNAKVDSQVDVNDVNGISGRRNFALVSADMWLQALKWHSNSKGTVKDGKSFSAAEDDMADVYPLQLKLFILPEVNTLGVRINKKG